MSHSFEDEIFSTEFGATLLVAAVALAIIVYTIVNVMNEFILFTKDLNLPSKKSFIVGTLFSFLTLAYVTYSVNHYYSLTRVLMMYLLFLVLYIIWCLNFSVSAEYHMRGARARTAGSFYLVFSTIVLLIMLYYSAQVSFGVSMLLLVPIAWNMYMLYAWWFRYAPWNVRSFAVPVGTRCKDTVY